MAPRLSDTQCPFVLPDGSHPNPYPAYAEMREAGEVHVVQETTGLQRWTLVRYEESRRALADERMSKDPRSAWGDLLQAGYVTGNEETDQYMFHILNSDPPVHTRLRRIALKALTVHRISEMRPRIQQVADGLLDRIGGQPHIDLIRSFALPFAVTVMGELLGVPTDHFDDYHACASAALMLPGAAGAPMTRAEAYGRMQRFIAGLVAAKRRELNSADPDVPQTDVTCALIAARDEEGQLADRELVALVMFLLNTGQEPTVNMIANGILALLEHPAQLDLLRLDQSLLPGAVEELLRFDGPVALSTLRVAHEDIDVQGTVIPKGAIVSILLNSANRDQRQFADPDALDITRSNNAHLAFGYGIHRCLGIGLARVMGQIAIGTLLRRYPALSLACAPGGLRWRSTRVMRALVELPVRLVADCPAPGD